MGVGVFVYIQSSAEHCRWRSTRWLFQEHH